MTLSDARFEKIYRIVSLNGGANMAQRLSAMGLYPGARVALASRAPLCGPLLIENIENNVQVALGTGVVEKIEVVEVEDGE